MPVTNEKYDQFKVDRLKNYLEDMTEKNQARLYEIFVDTLKVVPKTSDVTEFDNYERYMTEDTEKVRIVIYNSGLSNRNDQYCFYVHNKQKHDNGLGEIETIVQDKLAARDREHEMNQLREDLEEAKTKLKEAEEYAELLQGQLDQEKDTQQHKKLRLGELASIALEGIVRRNPQWLGKVPVVGEALAGIIEQDTIDKQQLLSSPPAPETAVSYQKKVTATQEVKPEHLPYIPLLRQLETAFDQSQLNTVWQVLEKFAQTPDSLQTVAELLNIQIVDP
jgi:hypothetical protein